MYTGITLKNPKTINAFILFLLLLRATLTFDGSCCFCFDRATLTFDSFTCCCFTVMEVHLLSMVLVVFALMVLPLLSMVLRVLVVALSLLKYTYFQWFFLFNAQIEPHFVYIFIFICLGVCGGEMGKWNRHSISRLNPRGVSKTTSQLTPPDPSGHPANNLQRLKSQSDSCVSVKVGPCDSISDCKIGPKVPGSNEGFIDGLKFKT